MSEWVTFLVRVMSYAYYYHSLILQLAYNTYAVCHVTELEGSGEWELGGKIRKECFKN